MAKFKKGDRVRIAPSAFDNPLCEINGTNLAAGDVGTVLEDDDDFPYVSWDRNIGGHSACGMCAVGHGFAVHENFLEYAPLTIAGIGYVGAMRQRLGDSAEDTSVDAQILAMTPMERVGLICAWNHGDAVWARIYKEYFESQGLYLTTDPNANGVLPREEG